MESITIGDVAAALMVLLYIAKKGLEISGWARGAMIADELRAALEGAADFIALARAGDVVSVDRASEIAAAQVRGLEAADVKPIVQALAEKAAGTHYGVTVSMDGDGNISVDPTGLASKLTRKAGKWLKKVF